MNVFGKFREISTFKDDPRHVVVNNSLDHESFRRGVKWKSYAAERGGT